MNFPVEIKPNNSNLETILSNSVIANGSPFTLIAPVVSGTLVSLFDIDVSGYSAALVILKGIYTGQAVAYDLSIDGDWVLVIPEDITVSYARLQTISGTGSAMAFNTYGAQRFRARITVMATGEMTATVGLSANSFNQKSTISGQSADNTAVVGHPVRIGAKAVSSTSPATNNQSVDVITTLDRRLVTSLYTIPENHWSNSVQITNTTTASTVKTALSSNKNYITSIQLSHDTLGTATELVIRSGAGGTVLWRTKLQTTEQPTMTITFPVPLQSATNTLLEVATLTATTIGTVYINTQGFTAS
jgi:hypothetical protein